jgi:hypothetical protein
VTSVAAASARRKSLVITSGSSQPAKDCDAFVAAQPTKAEAFILEEDSRTIRNGSRAAVSAARSPHSGVPLLRNRQDFVNLYSEASDEGRLFPPVQDQ